MFLMVFIVQTVDTNNKNEYKISSFPIFFKQMEQCNGSIIAITSFSTTADAIRSGGPTSR